MEKDNLYDVKIKESKEFETGLLIIGLLSLPLFGFGIIFLLLRLHLKLAREEFQEKTGIKG